MPVLEKDDIKAWDKARVEREMRDRLDDVAAIRQRNGDTLVGLVDGEAEKAREHNQNLNLLGEKLDELRSQEEGEGNFVKLSEYLNDPDPAAKRPLPQGVRDARFEQAAKDVGALFCESDALKAFVENGVKDKAVKVPVESVFGGNVQGIGEVPAMHAALFDSTGFPSRPDFRDDALVPTLYQANNIGPLMAQGSTNSDSIKYPVETVTATGAAEVAEGSTKPEAQISFADTTEPVQTIAVLLPITTRSFQNQPFLRAYINSRLRLFVQMREDAQLLNGNGTSPNLKGILNRSGINTATSYSIGGANPDQALIDAIFHASMRVQDAFLPPDAAVMKGSTWEIAALAKDGNRNYLLGGPGASGYAGNDPVSGARVWGLRVVINANMPAQSATNKDVLVGAFATSAMLVRRSEISLAISDSHSTFFAENKLMLRAEEDVALCVFRPAGFAAVTSAA
jgi:HK97 family phage major capsid protein